MNKTKSVIFNLGQNYARLEVMDILEKCGEDEELKKAREKRSDLNELLNSNFS